MCFQSLQPSSSSLQLPRFGILAPDGIGSLPMMGSRDPDLGLAGRSAHRETIAFLLLAVALSVLTVLAITSVDYLATSDGPERIFAGHAQRHALLNGRFLLNGRRARRVRQDGPIF